MSGVTPEEREKAALAVIRLHSFNVPTAGEILDALIAIGWGPGDAPVRPNREALADALGSLDEAKNREVADSGEYETWITIAVDDLADALRAADHLWAEEVTGRRAAWLAGAQWAARRWTGHPVDPRDFDPILDELYGDDSPPVGAPVVDREALARVLADWHDQTEETSDDHMDTADALFASGLFVDRVIVEREAAAGALDEIADVVWGEGTTEDVLDVVTTLRGRAAEYREGKR